MTGDRLAEIKARWARCFTQPGLIVAGEDVRYLLAEVERLTGIVQAVETLHQPREVWKSPFTDERGPQCSHCWGDDWPCPTVAALAAVPSTGEQDR